MDGPIVDKQYFASIKRIKADEWRQLQDRDFPFHDYEFFEALENSGVLGEQAGWLPQYQTVSENGLLVSASCLFKKTNSYGEYIFDWAWADAYKRYGVPYYPKMISSTPFTPATGAKLLFAADADRERLALSLLQAAKEEAARQQCSSLHYLFIAPDEIASFAREDFLMRHSFQYHWENQNYGSFADFLTRLKPKRRKQILRERSQLGEYGLTIRTLTGAELQPVHAELFYGFYLQTIRKMQGIPYLNQEFFRQVFSLMQQNILLMVAEDASGPIACSLFFRKGRNLYGRYWGSRKDVRHLHFELCYYRPIEWAIAHKVELFEAGAQGEHKIARGFVPRLTHSAHWIARPDFRAAIAGFVEEEKLAIADYFQELAEHNPYL